MKETCPQKTRPETFSLLLPLSSYLIGIVGPRFVLCEGDGEDWSIGLLLRPPLSCHPLLLLLLFLPLLLLLCVDGLRWASALLPSSLAGCGQTNILEELKIRSLTR